MINKFSPILLMAIVAVGCAKKESYEEVYKPKVKAKKAFFTADKDGFSEKKYLYVPMTLGTPRKVADANPFYQGGTKLVKLHWSKKGIEVVDMEKDERFSDNPLNNNPVLLIPGEYKQFDCKEDVNGDCSNVEEEVTDLEWYQKSNFEQDPSELKVREVNMLDLTNIDGSSCVTMEGKRVVNTEIIADEVYNIEIEKTYKLKDSWRCIRRNYLSDNFSQNSFKVRFFYSMVALDKLATPGYKPLAYPKQDHQTFGYFKSESSKLNPNFDSQRLDKTYLANRWDPRKKVLTYYLSASYGKPQNKHILEATMKSLKVMNKNLEASGAKFRLNFILQNKENEKSPGDLRYNSIVLIDDPLANGLLGYAPTVKNPETGEIVQGHINMYGGVLASGTRWSYENAVDVMEEQYQSKQTVKKANITVVNSALYENGIPSTLIDINIEESGVNKPNTNVAASMITPSSHVYSNAVSKNGKQPVRFLNHAAMVNDIASKEDHKVFMDHLLSGKLESQNELDKMNLELMKTQASQNMNGVHSPEFFPIAGTTKVVYPELLKIKNILDSRGVLKRWNKLNQSQKDEIAKISIVRRYTSTFVHEMGHSLGLRHNFAGSVDKDNFYTDKETRDILKVGGMTTEQINKVKAPAYSSVMDYAGSDFNELASFGKYDVAALKYSYAGKVKLSSGKDIEVDQSEGLVGIKAKLASEGLSLASYTFCTDENAGASTTCNRFDEGTNEVEIAKHKVLRYKNYYRYRNFRDGREDFSTTGIGEYIVGRYNEFGRIRNAVEDFEFFMQFFGQETMENGCSKEQLEQWKDQEYCEWISNRRQAVLDTADFFLEILKTPDHTCAIALKSNPTEVVAFYKLKMLFERSSSTKEIVTTCFDEDVKKFLATAGGPEQELIVVGEAGKYLNSFKGNDSIHTYASDRTVRGIWVDKVMAMRSLYQRVSRTEINDVDHYALVDHPLVKAKVQNYIDHLTSGALLDDPVPFKNDKGEEFKLPYVLSSKETADQMISGYFWGLKLALGLPLEGDVNLNKAILAQVNTASSSYDSDTKDTVEDLVNYVSLRKFDILANLNLDHEGVTHKKIDDEILVAKKNNVVATKLMTKVIEIEGDVNLVKATKPEVLANVLTHRATPPVPETYTEAETKYFNLEEGFQLAIINLLPQDGVPVQAFTQAFGEEDGKVLHKLYLESKADEGKRLKEIVEQKKEIASTPYEGATEEEKKLFKLSIEFIASVVEGKENELQKFYTERLLELPTI